MVLPLLAVLVLVLVLVYSFAIRRWMNRWGSTPPERRRAMAGDRLLVDPPLSYTTAVTINAPPADIWPWLAQLGYQRGGLYSYDWLDRLFGFLDRPSATQILPEFQHLAAGDRIPLGRGPSWPVAVAEPNRALVLDMRNLSGFDWVWQFGLFPMDDAHTRFVSRSQVRPHNALGWFFTLFFIEPSGFIMTRRMLLGIKARAEALHQRATFSPPDAGRVARNWTTSA